MSLSKITPDLARQLAKGDIVVSPHSYPPFAPLKVSETQTSPTGLVWVTVKKRTTPATTYWLPPAGCRWSRKEFRWLDASGTPWVKPTLEELGTGDDRE